MDQESRARFLDFAKFLDFDLVPDLDQSFAENDSCGLEAASLYAWVWAILDNHQHLQIRISKAERTAHEVL
jgi:hypothetical protein